MRVAVTQDDIDKGTRRDPCRCPVALAIKRALPGVAVMVGPAGYFLGDSPAFLLPPNAKTWIEQFDTPGAPTPGPFEFDIVSWRS